MADDAPPPGPRPKDFALLTAAFGALRPVHPNEDVIPLLAKTGAPNFQYRTFERPAPEPVPEAGAPGFDLPDFGMSGFDAPIPVDAAPEMPAAQLQAAPEPPPSLPPSSAAVASEWPPRREPVRREPVRHAMPASAAPPRAQVEAPPVGGTPSRMRGLRLADIFRGPSGEAPAADAKKRSLREIFGQGGRSR